MKIFKNMFGDNSKIHGDTIVVGSQSNNRGLNDSVIVDGGSNENGEYVKFGNGIAICWNIVRLEYWEAYTLHHQWTFPIAFIKGPNIAITPQGFPNGEQRTSICVYSNLSPSGARIALTNANKVFTSTDTRDVSVRAIGRWK